jgi:hypothetical protein
MTTDEIKTTLRQLHLELEQGNPRDPEVSELLRTLETDIHSLLAKPVAAAAPAAPAVTNRLDNMALQLEVDHPTLAPVLRQVSEALSRIGI